MYRRFAIAALAIGLAACSSSDNNSNLLAPNTTLAGTYVLQTIDAGALPHTMPDGTVLNAMSVVLNSDGTYSTTVDNQGSATTHQSGTFTLDGNTGTFVNSANGDTLHGSVDGTVLTITAAGSIWIFRKQ